MCAFFAELNTIKAQGIAARQLHALQNTTWARYG
jgi:hypothetical protein